jgi:MFS transporter, UMF1 family
MNDMQAGQKTLTHACEVSVMTQSNVEASANSRMGRSEWGWSLYQGGRDPYVVLVSIYIFIPYVVATVIGDAAKGQALVAQWAVIGGLITAVTAPAIGAIADRLGRKKPILGLVTLGLASLIACLWFVAPSQDGGLSLFALACLLIALGQLYAWNEVLHNSMLPGAATPETIPSTSGMAHVLGSLLSLAMLLFVLWGLALPGTVDAPVIPDEPLFGLDRATHEPSRIVPVIVAVFFLLLSLPLFLNTRDPHGTVSSPLQAVRDGFSDLVDTVKGLFAHHPNAARYLIARMLYTDGKTALLIFGGIVAKGVLQWSDAQMAAYGILMSVFAIGGGLMAARIDNGIGPKRAITAELTIIIVALILMSTITPRSILFIPIAEGHAVLPGFLFPTLPELVFLSIGAVVAVAITACYSSSRTMLTRVTPVGMEGRFFGLYALAGSATTWLGSLLVWIITAATGNQQAGLFSILLLFIAGLFLIRKVIERPD